MGFIALSFPIELFSFPIWRENSTIQVSFPILFRIISSALLAVIILQICKVSLFNKAKLKTGQAITRNYTVIIHILFFIGFTIVFIGFKSVNIINSYTLRYASGDVFFMSITIEHIAIMILLFFYLLIKTIASRSIDKHLIGIFILVILEFVASLFVYSIRKEKEIIGSMTIDVPTLRAVTLLIFIAIIFLSLIYASKIKLKNFRNQYMAQITDQALRPKPSLNLVVTLILLGTFGSFAIDGIIVLILS